MPGVELLSTRTALGCTLVAGVFAAFSGFVIAAFGQLSDAEGAAAMRSVNVTAVRPPLMVLLFGTAAACVAVLLTGPSVPQVAGVALYLTGTVGMAIAANVPLNDRLARDPSTWPAYRRSWTR